MSTHMFVQHMMTANYAMRGGSLHPPSCYAPSFKPYEPREATRSREQRRNDHVERVLAAQARDDEQRASFRREYFQEDYDDE
jgi:hypothetical protein